MNAREAIKGLQISIDTCVTLLHSRYQIRLELVQINIERTVEAKRGGNRGDYLGNEPIQIGEAWRGDVQVLLADVVNSFIVDLGTTGQSL